MLCWLEYGRQAGRHLNTQSSSNSSIITEAAAVASIVCSWSQKENWTDEFSLHQRKRRRRRRLEGGPRHTEEDKLS